MGQCETKSKQQTDSARSSPSVRIRTKSRRMQVAVAKTKKGAEEHKPHEFKVLLVGDSKVGKTSLILQLADGIFLQQQRATIGVDFKACTITVGDTTVLLNIWDTAGQERFRSITSSFYRGMEGVIVVYDVTEPDSFTHVRSWLRDVEEHGEGDAVTMIVGNKIDLVEQRVISTEQAAGLGGRVGVQAMETTATDRAAVIKVFGTLAAAMLKQQREQTS